MSLKSKKEVNMGIDEHGNTYLTPKFIANELVEMGGFESPELNGYLRIVFKGTVFSISLSCRIQQDSVFGAVHEPSHTVARGQRHTADQRPRDPNVAQATLLAQQFTEENRGAWHVSKPSLALPDKQSNQKNWRPFEIAKLEDSRTLKQPHHVDWRLCRLARSANPVEYLFAPKSHWWLVRGGTQLFQSLPRASVAVL